MIQNIQDLIDSLREELQQYGEMLALLDKQQELVMARAASEVFQLARLIQVQAGTIQTARSRREKCRCALAEHIGQPGDAAVAVLLPLLPADYRPLVRALVEENNALLSRIQFRARQNHLLLSRSVEFMQSLVNSLLPNHEVHVYDGQGNANARPAGNCSLYEAVG